MTHNHPKEAPIQFLETAPCRRLNYELLPAFAYSEITGCNQE